MQFSKLNIAFFVVANLPLFSLAKSLNTETKSIQLNSPLVKVNLNNFNQAETDLILNPSISRLGELIHNRDFTQVRPNEPQRVIRMNLDTLYSSGVFDLAAADVTIELPPTNGRYMSLMAIDEEQYALGEVIYPHVSSPKSATIFYCQMQSCTPESHTNNATSNSSSTSLLSLTRYVRLIIRILADPLDPDDLVRVHSLQDKINVVQQHKGEFVSQNWDTKSHLELRTLLISLAPFIAPGTVIFGTRQEVDPLGHLIGTAAYWGGLPIRDSVYEAHYPPDSYTIDSGTIYTITVKGDEVPIYVPGFWSVTVYNSNGYLQYNEWGSYSENSLSALSNETYNATNGSEYVIYFSMVRADYMKNWILIFPGWNYIVRLYHPLEIVVNGQWKFPPLVEIVSPVASTAFKIDPASFRLVILFFIFSISIIIYN